VGVERVRLAAARDGSATHEAWARSRMLTLCPAHDDLCGWDACVEPTGTRRVEGRMDVWPAPTRTGPRRRPSLEFGPTRVDDFDALCRCVEGGDRASGSGAAVDGASTAYAGRKVLNMSVQELNEFGRAGMRRVARRARRLSDLPSVISQHASSLCRLSGSSPTEAGCPTWSGRLEAPGRRSSRGEPPPGGALCSTCSQEGFKRGMDLGVGARS